MIKEAKGRDIRTWVDISRQNIVHNYDVFRNWIGPIVKMMAVVKSNAYGHGLLEFSKYVEKLKVDWFGVDSIVEGLTLRNAGIKKPVLVLGHTLESRLDDAVENEISLTVSTLEMLDILSKKRNSNGRKIKIHLKIDTGMHRQGFLPEQTDDIVSILKKIRNKIIVEGVYTHFAAAKNPSFPKDTYDQIESFEKVIWKIKKAGFSPIIHAAATSGTLIFPKSHFDMGRIGIGLYGMWPSVEVEKFFEGKIKLKPVLSWKTIIGEVKTLPDGGWIG